MDGWKTLTEQQIARAVRAGFFKAGADPERYADLVDVIVSDVALAVRRAGAAGPDSAVADLDHAA